MDGQFVAALIPGDAGVAFDPAKFHLVFFTEFEQLIPQVGVEGRGFVGFLPSVGFPFSGPPLGDAVDHIAGITVQDNGTGFFDGAQAGDASHQLHPVVGGPSIAFGKLHCFSVLDDEGAVTAGTGVAQSTAVRIHDDLAWFDRGWLFWQSAGFRGGRLSFVGDRAGFSFLVLVIPDEGARLLDGGKSFVYGAGIPLNQFFCSPLAEPPGENADCEIT